jgi:MOSC domain-containing protein YiiM
MDLAWAVFSENFTTEGLLEETVHIGDRFRVGSAEFAVTQPRIPCFKLGIRFDRSDIVKRFLQSGRTGFYFAVLREGEVTAGDTIELLNRDEHGVTVADHEAVPARCYQPRSVAPCQRATFASQKLARLLRTGLWNPDD